jgi:hypothetical protein
VGGKRVRSGSGVGEKVVVRLRLGLGSRRGGAVREVVSTSVPWSAAMAWVDICSVDMAKGGSIGDLVENGDGGITGLLLDSTLPDSEGLEYFPVDYSMTV